MGRVQNLRKRFSDWVNGILVDLSYHYIKQLAKQTSRKQGNSLSTECLQNNLTTGHQSITIATSSQDTSEKIIMEPATTEDIVLNAKNWAEERLEQAESIGAKDAIYKEFEEWIEVDDDTIELEIMSLEPLEEYYNEED